jgi:beta-glucosidase
VNPSGKLPVTFPNKLEDSPAHVSERTYGPEVSYHDEGIFVGYRYFDKNEIEPLFPFGFGLSYTIFKYENLKISKTQVSGNEKFSVSVDITNSGKRSGAEIIQLYVQDVKCSVERPPKELKGFKKIFLEPGKRETVKIELDKSSLSFWGEKTNAWRAEKGKFNILVGSSSRDILLRGEIEYL